MTFEKLYIDCNHLIVDLIPFFKRKEKFVEFMKLFSEEMQLSHNDLYEIIVDSFDKSKYNGQIGVLEEWLNNKYDYSLRRIYITNNAISGGIVTLYLQGEYDPSPSTLYLQSEEHWGWSLWLQSEVSGLQFYNFTINIPTALWSALSTAQQNQFIARVSIFVLAGKTFNIATF